MLMILKKMIRIRAVLALICALGLGFSSLACANTAPPEFVPIQRTSPFAVYQSFIDATERLENDYSKYVADKTTGKLKALLADLRRIRQLLDLSDVPPATRARIGDSAIAHLYDILARLPPLEPETIPGYADPHAPAGAQDLPLRWNIPGTDIQIGRIEEGPYSGEYQFTAETVAHLAEYHNAIISSPLANPRTYSFFHLEQSNATGPWIPDSFVQSFPAWLQKHYFNTPSWKILLITLTILGLITIAMLWVRFAWKRALATTGLSQQCRRLSIPIGLLVLLYCGDTLITTQLYPVGNFANAEGLIASILYYSLFAWLAWLLVYFLIEAAIRFLDVSSRRYDESLLRLSAKLAAIIAVAIILIQGADQLGIPALGLLAGFGIGGIAVALASQSTLENIFSGISLFADRPFRVGDKIFFDKQSALVLRIGPRSTRLRYRDGSLCTVPNSDLAKMHVVNYSLRNCCYVDQTISLCSESPPESIRQLIGLIRERMEVEDLVEQGNGWPRVQLVGVNLGLINIRICATVLTTNYSEFLCIQESIMLDVLSFLKQLNLKLYQPLDKQHFGRI